MITNRNIKIVGKLVILVPYRVEHVEKYHSWMQSEELQALTASEPLTLPQEYEMQKSWTLDESKCTFIVLNREVYDKTNSEIEAMIGDTNLYFSNDVNRLVAEAEIMIANPCDRKLGFGWDAMVLMFLFAIEHFSVQLFVVKVGMNNGASLHMFEKLGFCEVSRSEVFKEVTLEMRADKIWTEWLKVTVGAYQIIKDE